MPDYRDWEDAERVTDLARRIGYGRVMQLASQLWAEADGLGAKSVGPCIAELVPCEGPQHDPAHPDHPHCDWCCGARRVTKKVAEAITEDKWEPPTEDAISSSWERL